MRVIAIYAMLASAVSSVNEGETQILSCYFRTTPGAADEFGAERVAKSEAKFFGIVWPLTGRTKVDPESVYVRDVANFFEGQKIASFKYRLEGGAIVFDTVPKKSLIFRVVKGEGSKPFAAVIAKLPVNLDQRDLYVGACLQKWTKKRTDAVDSLNAFDEALRIAPKEKN
jgi:hypothetical protein